MKAKAYIDLWWGNQYGRPLKSVEEIEVDRWRAREILEWMGCGTVSSPEQEFCEFELDVGSKALRILVEELQNLGG
jgi:hypothetical protein